MKRDVLDVVAAANEELRGIDLDALKKESTLVLEPPRIEVTVGTSEDATDRAPNGDTTSSQGG